MRAGNLWQNEVHARLHRDHLAHVHHLPDNLSSACTPKTGKMDSSIGKLEQFLLMAKSAKGAAAAKLVQDATAAPGVYVFGELLELPSIAEVVFLLQCCSETRS